ncbi:MAG: TrmH family RNA methyltransferase [Candidatus Bruticola sp.]
MEFEIIGRHSRLVKEIKRLDSPGHRAETGRFLVEGIRVVEELLSSNLDIVHLLISERLIASEAFQWAEQVKKQRPQASIWIASDSLMQDLSAAKTSQGVLAVAELPQFEAENILSVSRLLVLSQIQDPGNVGTLIRSALAFNFEAVLVCGGADPYNARAVRSAAGGVFHLPVLRAAEDELDYWSQKLRENGFSLITAEAHGGRNINEVSFPEKSALILGAEVKGVDRSWRSKEHIKVHIPLALKSESLNVAAAGAVIMYCMAHFK